MENFRNKYRNIDLLLIDDIQFIAGKDRLQEEFFHTFNTLRENGKQIVLSSDKPPRDIPLLEDRLKSRFEWGILADIAMADYEVRLAILRKKADEKHAIIDDDILKNIAAKIDSNIRFLLEILNIGVQTLGNGVISMTSSLLSGNSIETAKIAFLFGMAGGFMGANVAGQVAKSVWRSGLDSLGLSASEYLVTQWLGV